MNKENIMNLADAYAAEVANTPQMPTPLERKLAVVRIGTARAALEATLMQPVQEPVGWVAEVELSAAKRSGKEKFMVELWKKRLYASDIALHAQRNQND